LRQALISEIEASNANPMLMTIEKLAIALDVQVSELFELD
jgi:transcriptional regulator with XRE-family HTH domain